MIQWNGLLRKEWVSMKWMMYASIVVSILFVSILPIAIKKSNEAGIGEFYNVGLVIVPTWTAFSTLVPLLVLFISLGREMKRPDIWLHSPVSIFKLIGVKMSFALVVSVVFFLPSIIITAQSILNSAGAVHSFISICSMFLVELVLITLLILGAGFFFWVIYKAIEPYLKGFTSIVVLIIYFISAGIYKKVKLTTFYERVEHLGILNRNWIDIFRIKAGINQSDIQFTSIYAGELLLNLAVPTMLFILAAVLFDKKVRY